MRVGGAHALAGQARRGRTAAGKLNRRNSITTSRLVDLSIHVTIRLVDHAACPKIQSVRFFIFPHWVIGQCEKIILEHFFLRSCGTSLGLVSMRVNVAERALRPRCCSVGRSECPRLVDSHRHMRVVVCKSKKEACFQSLVFHGPIVESLLLDLWQTCARLVDLN